MRWSAGAKQLESLSLLAAFAKVRAISSVPDVVLIFLLLFVCYGIVL
jgi:hypothetical protein